MYFLLLSKIINKNLIEVENYLAVLEKQQSHSWMNICHCLDCNICRWSQRVLTNSALFSQQRDPKATNLIARAVFCLPRYACYIVQSHSRNVYRDICIYKVSKKCIVIFKTKNKKYFTKLWFKIISVYNCYYICKLHFIFIILLDN